MAMSAGGGGALTSEPNVTPMIDVLLVLLIIFMVVIALGRTAMDIQIPPIDTASKSSDVSTQIVLQLKDDGSYWINGHEHPKAELSQAFHDIYDPRPSKLLFVKPDPNRLYGDVIEAMDIARGAGVEVIGFTPIEANGGK
ncbi:MAG TPA: biopolymer transporter ExbD [Gemmatimonadales bacterium]|jgi:biopolymer transport protein ExbD|nr:biopolymer transporter ExbD [Gemmatimonadales bacterium]